jgi:rhombotarget A family protien
MLKRGIGLVLLCMASHVYSANIIVTTTEDVVANDNECSLREAIEYVNKGLPEAGYNGCGGKDSTKTIILNSKTYKLNAQVEIHKDLEIRTQYQSDFNDGRLGRHNAIIKMVGNDRLFEIDRKKAPPVPVPDGETAEKDTIQTIQFHEVTLEGCGTGICADKGGLIYNKERLGFNYSQLLKGHARLGGAIYNESTYSEGVTLSYVYFLYTTIKDNKANQGAVYYGDFPQFFIEKSLIRDNEATDAAASSFDTLSAFTEEQLNALANESRGMLNTTIFNNKGFVAKIRDGVLINNITMIANEMGLIIDAPLSRATVANSILVQNGTEDCRIIAGGAADKISNNLYSTGCTGTSSQALGNITLFAGSSAEGECDVNSDGILCPLREYDDYTLPYFKPRLLPSYSTESNSPIVNRGPFQLSTLQACNVQDQRAKVRPNNKELCDRGAVELTVDSSKSWSLGQDILFGQIASDMTVKDKLHDGELVTPAQCQTIFGTALDQNGQPWQPGCLKVEQTNTPSKGRVTITQDGQVTYTPNSNWDGSDEFKIMVVSSTTRFTDSSNVYISIPTKIVQRPPNNFQDYKVKVSGGSLGFGSLVVLAGLIGFRRYKK